MFASKWFNGRILAIAVVVLGLSGCGGGSSTPAPPPPNQAPTANAGADQTVDEGTPVNLTGSGTDSDGTIASFSWVQNSGTTVTITGSDMAGASFDAPMVAATEDLVFTLTVTDNDGATGSDTVTITVVSVNMPPTADAGPDQAVSSLALVTLDGSGSADVDGTVDVYAWTQTAGTSVTLDETVPAMPTFTAPNVGGDEVLTFELQVTDNDGLMSGIDSVLITINPTLALPFGDDFSDGNSDGWTMIDDSISIASNWDASSGRLVQGGPTSVFSGDNTETYRRGTYSFLTDSLNLTNYRFSVDVTLRPGRGSTDDLGIMFRYTDNDHYYRFSLNSQGGSARLESKAGVDINNDPIYQTLAHNTRGYRPSVTQRIVVEVDGPLIQIFVNDDPLFAASNADHATGGIALYARDGVRFDNVSITTNGTSPEIVIASPIADTVIPGGPRNVNVVAIARNVPAGTGTVDIEFLGEAACGAVTETTPGVFTAGCPGRTVDNHQVRAKILDSGVEVDRDTNNDVSIGAVGIGDRYDAIGDSLTLGLFDNYSTDNLNLTDSKTISMQGWTGPLSDMLTTTKGAANVVGNEGISGDRSWETRLFRLTSILERNSVPKSNRALLMLGTNDSNTSNPTASGLGCVGAACDGTYNGHMTGIINALLGADRATVYLGILPPAWGASLGTVYADPLDAPNAARTATIQEYNQVIINELSTIPGVVLGPDFFSCFLTPTVNRFSMFEDSLHMNSLGYAFVAALWHDAITGAAVVPPVDPCPSPIYILESLDPYVHGHKQNLLEAGNEYYTDASFVLTNVPSELANGIWVSQANADNTNELGTFLDFDAGTTPVTVYIAFDPAGGPPISSTHAFVAPAVPLSSALTVSDGTVGTFSIVEALNVTGPVSIGGTMSDGTGIARQGYLVIVVP